MRSSYKQQPPKPYYLSRPKDKEQQSTITNNSRNTFNFNYRKHLKPAIASEEEIQQIKAIFDLFDTQGRGLIKAEGSYKFEILDLINSLNGAGYKSKQTTVYQYIMNLAADGAGEIQFETFLTMVTPKVTQQDSQPDMNQLFTLFDDQKRGYITVQNLRRSIQQMHIQVDQKQLQKMIELADNDNDGRVTAEDFYKMMTSL